MRRTFRICRPLVLVLIGSVVRAGAPAQARPLNPPAPVTLEWVGDMAMSTELGLPPGGVAGALAPVREWLRQPGITFGNLEGTLSSGNSGSKCGGSVTGTDCYAFQAPPTYAYGLRAVGFKLVNQANNHSMDFGWAGRGQTVAALQRAGIAETGFPDQITYLNTHHVRIAFLGFAPYQYDSELLDIPAAQALVRRARRHAQLVVVTIHAGAEGAQYDHVPYGSQYFLGEDRGDARAFAHAVINAGATLVVGSGPHVIRGVEDYRGHLIAYSLGDFLGYHTLGGAGVLSQSAILQVTLDPQDRRVVAAQWISVGLTDGLPHPEPSNASAHLVAALSRADFPRDHFYIQPNGKFRLPKARARRR